MLPTWAIQFIFAAAIIGGAYWYWTWSQGKIEDLREDVIVLEMARETDQATIATQRRTIDYNAKAYKELTQENQRVEQYKDNLIEIFQEHDLQRLAVAKPGLIEIRINNGTSQVFSDLESITATDGLPE